MRTLVEISSQEPEPEAESIFENLKRQVVGQERAIRRLVRGLEISKAGLKDPIRPIGTFLFLGPTGVGKTHLGKKLAEILLGGLYHSRPPATLIECARIAEEHEISCLTGAAPGYIGYGDPPKLCQWEIDKYGFFLKVSRERQISVEELERAVSRSTEERRTATAKDPSFSVSETRSIPYNVNNILYYEGHKPYLSVIIFDEFEKAHPKLEEILLTIIQEGCLTLSNGSVTDFRNAIIILTSNVGSEEIARVLKGTGIGFTARPPALDTQEIDRTIYRQSLKAAERKFKPEFIGRVKKNIVAFRPLAKTDYLKIIDLHLAEIQQRVKTSGKGIRLFISDAMKEFLVAEGISEGAYGARPLNDEVEKRITTPLARAINSGQIQEGELVYFDFDLNKGVVMYRESKESMCQKEREMEA